MYAVKYSVYSLSVCTKLIQTANLFYVVPSAPCSLKMVTVTSTTVTLQWQPPMYPNGVITQYSIQYDGLCIDDFGDNVSDMLMGTVKGLPPDTDYVFEIKAHTRVGPGPPVSLPVKTCKLLNNNTHTFLGLEFYIIATYYVLK